MTAFTAAIGALPAVGVQASSSESEAVLVAVLTAPLESLTGVLFPPSS
jgi:hypothetical protein